MKINPYNLLDETTPVTEARDRSLMRRRDPQFRRPLHHTILVSGSEFEGTKPKTPGICAKIFRRLCCFCRRS